MTDPSPFVARHSEPSAVLVASADASRTPSVAHETHTSSVDGWCTCGLIYPCPENGLSFSEDGHARRGRPLTAVSLFAGVGGMDLACEAAGINVIATAEIDKNARGVLRHHWPDTHHYTDVKDVTRAGLLRDVGALPGPHRRRIPLPRPQHRRRWCRTGWSA